MTESMRVQDADGLTAGFPGEPFDPSLLAQDSFDSDAYYNRLGRTIRFELTSWAGRMLGFLPRFAATREYLNLGSGAAPHIAFTNIDFYAPRTKLSLLRKGYSFVQHDLRFPLPFADETFQGVYSEHCVEHLYPTHAQALFRQALRVLKPGGVFRLITPDIAKYIAVYNKRPCRIGFSDYINGCEAIWAATQNWGHVSVWDAEMLDLKLRQAGFPHVEVLDFRQGKLPALLVDLEMRRPYSVYVEAYKD
jgi:SAM-dependent methyltransferase